MWSQTSAICLLLTIFSDGHLAKILVKLNKTIEAASDLKAKVKLLESLYQVVRKVRALLSKSFHQQVSYAAAAFEVEVANLFNEDSNKAVHHSASTLTK